jgi:hypothetical protein
MPPNIAATITVPEDIPHEQTVAIQETASNDALYMPEEILPPPRNREANSTQRLTRREVQLASTMVKRFVERRLETDLNVFEVRKIRRKPDSLINYSSNSSFYAPDVTACGSASIHSWHGCQR